MAQNRVLNLLLSKEWTQSQLFVVLVELDVQLQIQASFGCDCIHLWIWHLISISSSYSKYRKKATNVWHRWPSSKFEYEMLTQETSQENATNFHTVFPEFFSGIQKRLMKQNERQILLTLNTNQPMGIPGKRQFLPQFTCVTFSYYFSD